MSEYESAKLKRKVILADYSMKLMMNSLYSFFIVLLGVIIWGIVLFIFDDYKCTWEMSETIDNISMWSLMGSFILNAVIFFLAIIVFLPNMLFLKKKHMFNSDDIYTGEAAMSLNSVSNLSNSDTAKVVVTPVMVNEGNKVFNSFENIIEQLINKTGAKRANKYIVNSLYVITTILMILLVGANIVDGVYSKKHIITSRETSINLIKQAYQNNEDIKFRENEIMDSFNVGYNNVDMNFYLDENGKEDDIYYSMKIDNEDLDNILVDTIENELRYLQSNTKDFSNIFTNEKITKVELELSDELKNKFETMREVDEYSEEKIFVVGDEEITIKYKLEYTDYSKNNINDGDLWFTCFVG